MRELQQPHFAILPRLELGLDNGYFDVQIVFRQIEIGGEKLNGYAAGAPSNREPSRFVGPLDPIKIEQLC